MYCHHCRKQIPDGSNYCAICGTRQATQSPSNTKRTAPVSTRPPKTGSKFIWFLLAGILIFVFIIARNPDTGNTSFNPESSSQLYSENNAIQDGWNASQDQYYKDGNALTGHQCIDGFNYYFDNDGYLMRQAEIPHSLGSMYTDENGILRHYTYDEVFGTWAEESFCFEDGSYAAVLELETDIVQCYTFDFILEARSANGVSIDGAWIIYTRSSNGWTKVGTFQFQEPSTPMHITFNPTGNFNKIMARPVDARNAKYSCNYRVQNVLCAY